MHGIGKTVFQGDKIEDFDVEILGVLENVGPRESLIIARIDGGPLAHTGIMQGMSGSPVYIDGKLIGALAFAFPFAKDPIGAIRPIEEMIHASNETAPVRRAAAPTPANLLAGMTKPEAINGQMLQIATPISFGGFTSSTIDYFSPQLKALGLEPRQGAGMGGRVDDHMGNPSTLHPGSMISVELMTGDLAVGADGTVTHIDGDKIYAFGHRFMDLGPTGLPFTRSEVLALLPNLSTSFKISAPRELMGVISQDRNTAIAGTLGKRAGLLPVEINMARAGHHLDTYRINVIHDRYLSPVLLQMAVFSAIDATERGAGESSISVNGEIQLEGRPPIPVSGIYAGDANLPVQASLAGALPLAYLMQGGFDGIQVKKISVAIDSTEAHKQLQIEDVTVSRKEVHPGESVEITTRLAGENGFEILRTVKYEVPIGAAPGTLFFSVNDGAQTSIAELRATYGSTARNPTQLIEALHRLRANDKAYLRVWRAEPSYEISGEEIPDPPPSLALILNSTVPNTAIRNSKVAEFVIDGGGNLVTGSKTVQVEVHS
jgi:SpoIVB peptidase S55